jgi:hypothetical protein
VDGLGDVCSARVLGEIAASACLQRGKDRRVVVIGGQHHDGDVGVPFGQPAGGLGAVEHGHVEVEQDHVGVGPGSEFECLLAVGRGGDDLEIGEQAKQQDKSFADGGVVVGDDDPQRRGRAGHRGISVASTQSLPPRPAVSVPCSSRRRSFSPASPYPLFTVASCGP